MEEYVYGAVLHDIGDGYTTNSTMEHMTGQFVSNTINNWDTMRVSDDDNGGGGGGRERGCDSTGISHRPCLKMNFHVTRGSYVCLLIDTFGTTIDNTILADDLRQNEFRVRFIGRPFSRDVMHDIDLSIRVAHIRKWRLWNSKLCDAIIAKSVSFCEFTSPCANRRRGVWRMSKFSCSKGSRRERLPYEKVKIAMSLFAFYCAPLRQPETERRHEKVIKMLFYFRKWIYFALLRQHGRGFASRNTGAPCDAFSAVVDGNAFWHNFCQCLHPDSCGATV